MTANARGEPAAAAASPKWAALYLRAAGALERSTWLAGRHAQRERDNGSSQSAEIELARARRARQAARRARRLAAEHREPRPRPRRAAPALPQMVLNAAQVEATLARNEQAPGVARRLLAQGLPALTGDELNRTKLLTSELVANAVVHGRGEIVLRARLDDNRLLVEVIDEGSGFVPTVHELDPGSVGGRGLAIVDATASRWGIHEGSTHVWFELERSEPRLGRGA